MLTEERIAKILEILERDGSVSVQKLVSQLDTSESTIRRDLNAMDARGLLVKVHGGAMARPMNVVTQDEQVSNREEVNVEEKTTIGKYAAGLIQPGDFVYLDAGTTTARVIDYLNVSDAIFVTNSIEHVLRLSRLGYRAFILGGVCKSVTEAIVGAEAVTNLEKYNFNIGFWGTNAIHPANGFSTPEVREAIVKKKGIEHCTQSYVLADSTKFGLASNVKFADFEQVKVITTDKVPEEYKQYSNVIIAG